MLFSVITVCRNAEETIARALRSVAEQDHPEIEHLVIDGLSSDHTRAIAVEQVRAGGVVISEADDGIYNAMNKGLRMASGQIIAFLNADDFYARRTAISEVAELFGRSGPDAIFGNVSYFSPDDPGRAIRIYDSGSFRPSRLRWGIMPAHPATFVRKRVFDEVGFFAEDFDIAADFEMAVRMFGKSSYSTLHYPEVLVRMSTGGVSTRGWRSAMTINRESVQACRRNGIYTNRLMIAAKYPFKLRELRR